jgi:hypothetical protein
MQDLVFELRHELADLNYRLQVTDVKVATCVHLLSSMEGNLARDSAVNMSKAAPDANPGAGTSSASRPVSREPMTTEHDSRDKGKEREETGEPDYEPTYNEEEPWPGDLPPMWPTFSPGV